MSGNKCFKKPMGRPTDLTTQIQKMICEALAKGNYIEAAAAYAGITKQAMYCWMKRGRKETEGIYRDFIDAVEQAMGEGEARHVENIAKHSNGDWRASAWMLERKFPLKWGSKSVVKHLDQPNDLIEPDEAKRPDGPTLATKEANVVIYIPKNNKEVE